MTQFIEITPDFFVAGQLDLSRIKDAASEGVKTIFNFRPNGEKAGYVSADQAASEAEANGVTYHHLPVAMSGPRPDQVASFAKLFQECEGPVLAHCGTGKRAAVMWALSHKGKMTADEILSHCGKSGHDLSMLRPHL